MPFCAAGLQVFKDWNKFVCRHPYTHIRVRLHWSQKQQNSTVWTDSGQRIRNKKHYCLCQWLHWNRYNWNAISSDFLAPTEWVCFKLTVWSDTCCIVHIGFKCHCNVAVSMDTHVGLNVVTHVCDVYPDKCWFAVLCQFWLHCGHTLTCTRKTGLNNLY